MAVGGGPGATPPEEAGYEDSGASCRSELAEELAEELANARITVDALHPAHHRRLSGRGHDEGVRPPPAPIAGPAPDRVTG
ncbi:hypothetical protein ACFU5O_31295 [Streptomyces sp. NPDC057445]|uniref:hypothetical protein n=1 Tax=Streptomyces sp. NPDC057445 TaxID=3346136 RepID=UPI0036B4BCFB